MTKNHIWSTRKKREVIDERVRKENTEYTSPYDLVPDVNDYVSIEVDVTFETGKYYRVLVCADNQFDLKGLDNTVPDPVNGGTQFFLYTERTYQEITKLTAQSNVVNFDPSDTVDFQRDQTNTTVIVDNGDEFAVNAICAVAIDGTVYIKTARGNKEIYTGINHENVTITGSSAGNSVNAVVDALNALFQVLPISEGGNYISTLPTLAGVDITANFAEGQDPIGDSIYGVGTSTGQHDARVWSDETINDTGEFYEVKITGKGQFMLGLYSVADGDLTEIQNNTGNGHTGYLWAQAFYNYGSYIGPWTTYGSNSNLSYGPGWSFYGNDSMMRYNTIVQDNLENADPANPVLFKVGINAQGYIAVYYFDEGRTNDYIMTARSSYTLPDGEYGLMVKLVNGTVQLIETPTRTAVDPVAPTLTYMYVESNGFDYPLFATAEEANHYDSLNGGGGTSTGVIYPDDSTNTQWFRPTNGFTQNAVSAPTDTSEITYNSIPTETIIPDAFTSTTIEVNEGSNFNTPIDPSDHDWTTSVTGENWGNLTAGNLTGTAPQVTGDYNTNPNDEYTFTITRTAEGSSQGVLTIRVINLTAPVTAITGFNHHSDSTAMIDSDTMDDGSVVHVNNTVADGERFVIEQAYIETNILPALQANGDQYIIGLQNTGADFTTLELSDFDAAIVWEYENATSHTFKFYRDGSVVQNIVINSLTDAYYDYAIEVNGTSAWLIACNVNSIMNEASPADGGSFSHTYEATSIEDTAPVQIHMATLNTTGDISTDDIETITTPTPAPTILTDWTKALDFNGSNEYAKQVSNSTASNAIKMGGSSTTIGYWGSTKTVPDSQGRPWSTAVVFKPDNNSNATQTIWNNGAGANTGVDNIFIMLNGSTNELIFEWGRNNITGGFNRCTIATGISSSNWYGVYVTHKGTRYSGANATASNLEDIFDIRVMSSADSFNAVGTNKAIAANWTHDGGQMDRSVSGNFTVAGRGTNRPFYGKVSSMIVSTLMLDTLIPTDAEIKTMITDPTKWLQDYKVGNSFRACASNNTSTFAVGSGTGYFATQVWLMGDGVSDSYSNGVRNQVLHTDQNYTKLQLNSMVSNDFETVTINGLT